MLERVTLARLRCIYQSTLITRSQALHTSLRFPQLRSTRTSLSIRRAASTIPPENERPDLLRPARRADARVVLRYLIYAAATSVLFHAFLEYGYGDWVVISKWYRRGRGVVVGDVVSFKHPAMNEMSAVKRVIGMPGDFVVDSTPGTANARMIQVPQGHCWLVGDNLAHSRDSRVFGPLPLALVDGKVIAKIETAKGFWSSFWSSQHYHRMRNGLEEG